MSNVRDLLRRKPAGLWTVSPNDSVFRALELMAEKDVGAVLILEHDKLVGIFSERDYARNVILHGRSSRDTRIGEFLQTEVLYLRPDQSIEECMALMTAKRVRHLPVLEDESLVGIVSIGDVVQATIAEHEFMIHQLENYITGERR